MSFFFFQAEDGIRDWSVTGVQTCALPIYTAGPVGAGVPPDSQDRPHDRRPRWGGGARAEARERGDSVSELGSAGGRGPDCHPGRGEVTATGKHGKRKRSGDLTRVTARDGLL